MRALLFLLIINLFGSGCSQNPNEQVKAAIDVAQSYLSNNQCGEALTVLTEVGHKADNPLYLQVLASAHACKAGFSEIDFLLTDIENIDATAENLLKSLATLSTSDETQVDSTAYTSLRTAIYVLQGTAATATHLQRVATFGQRKAGDLSIQLLLMSLAQLGKFVQYFGNTDATGAKGGGTETSKCFMGYDDTQALLVLSQTPHKTGACVNPPEGHPKMVFSPAAELTATKRRSCEGLMLVTNILDILENLDLSANSALAELAAVGDVIGDFKGPLVIAGLDDLMDTTLQSECIANISSAANFNRMQRIYALLFEVGLQ